MKILLTTDTYFPMINGVALSTNNLYKELKNMGHDVRIMTLSPDGKEKFCDDIYYLKSFKAGVYPGARIKVPFAGESLVNILNWSPDIIHSQTEFSTMATAKIIKSKLAIPQIHTYHTMYEDYLDYFLGGKIIRKNTASSLTRLLLNSFQGVIAPTEKVKETLLSYGVNCPLSIIPTGIDLNKFKEELPKNFKDNFYKKYNITDSDVILGYVGRIGKEKNIEEIINYIDEIKNPRVKLMIVGGGPHLEELKNIASHNKNVIFTGMIDPKNIQNYYKLCHIFVTASKSETQGLTYIEALSSGCPIICRKDKAVSGLIKNGINGYMYNNGQEFKEQLQGILNNKALYNSMSSYAVLSSEPYSTKNFALNVLKIYENILNLSKAA